MIHESGEVRKHRGKHKFIWNGRQEVNQVTRTNRLNQCTNLGWFNFAHLEWGVNMHGPGVLEMHRYWIYHQGNGPMYGEANLRDSIFSARSRIESQTDAQGLKIFFFCSILGFTWFLSRTCHASTHVLHPLTKAKADGTLTSPPSPRSCKEVDGPNSAARSSTLCSAAPFKGGHPVCLWSPGSQFHGWGAQTAKTWSPLL